MRRADGVVAQDFRVNRLGRNSHRPCRLPAQRLDVQKAFSGNPAHGCGHTSRGGMPASLMLRRHDVLLRAYLPCGERARTITIVTPSVISFFAASSDIRRAAFLS
jgi:hypothetical protein